MSYKFKALSSTDDFGIKIYHKTTFEFEPGITCLVGCNGSGKTTLLKGLSSQLESKDIPVICYFGLNATSKLSYRAQTSHNPNAMVDFLNTRFISEGERVKEEFSLLVGEIGHFVFNQCVDVEKAFILIDSLDSGSSIDNVRELREFFIDTVIGEKPTDLELYVIIAVNDYEFARDCDCIDVQTSKHQQFHNYQDYVNYVMKTRKLKDKRFEAYQKAKSEKRSNSSEWWRKQ